MAQPCKYLARFGSCKRGESCEYSHLAAQRPSSPSRPARHPEGAPRSPVTYRGELSKEEVSYRGYERAMWAVGLTPQFKTAHCSEHQPFQDETTLAQCKKWHSVRDRRRHPYVSSSSDEVVYKSGLCNGRDASGVCIHGLKCTYALNLYERNYHPFVFRTSKCPAVERGKQCKNTRCSFYHTEAERRASVPDDGQTAAIDVEPPPNSKPVPDRTDLWYTVENGRNVTLGEGSGNTMVYDGWYRKTPNQLLHVAIKTVRVFEASAEQRRIEREMDILSDLRCERVVQCYHAFKKQEDDELKYFLVLEYMPFSLDKAHAKFPNRNLSDWLPAFRGLLQALKFLHSRDIRIYHRDIKPANVLVTQDLQAKLCDADRSKQVKVSDSQLMPTLDQMGTLGWAAKELKEHTARGHELACCDIFSLGLVFFYIASGGRHLFDHDEACVCCGGKEKLFTRLQKIQEAICKETERTGLNQLGETPLAGLLESMTRPLSQGARPNAQRCLQHPLFLAREEIALKIQGFTGQGDNEISFYAWLRGEERKRNLLVPFDLVAGWRVDIEDIVKEQEECPPHPHYDGFLVSDLLRFYRNVLDHSDRLPHYPLLQAAVSQAGSIYQLFVTLFPRLLQFHWMYEERWSEYLRQQSAVLQNLRKQAGDDIDSLDTSSDTE